MTERKLTVEEIEEIRRGNWGHVALLAVIPDLCRTALALMDDLEKIRGVYFDLAEPIKAAVPSGMSIVGKLDWLLNKVKEHDALAAEVEVLREEIMSLQQDFPIL